MENKEGRESRRREGRQTEEEKREKEVADAIFVGLESKRKPDTQTQHCRRQMPAAIKRRPYPRKREVKKQTRIARSEGSCQEKYCPPAFAVLLEYSHF